MASIERQLQGVSYRLLQALIHYKYTLGEFPQALVIVGEALKRCLKSAICNKTVLTQC